MRLESANPGVVATAKLDPQPAQDGVEGRMMTRFRVIPAITDELRDEVFRIRHEVFCEDFALFEPRPDRRETDEFDERAVLLLLRNAVTREYVGCVRVVTGRRNDPAALLPFESVCRDLIDKKILDLDKLPRDHVGEVSRLGVIGKYRRRKGEASFPVPIETAADEAGHTPERRQFPYILTSLYLGAYAIAQREHIQYLFTFTELRLLNHLNKLGVPLNVIGASIQHKGLRVPAVVNVFSLVSRLNPFVRALYEQITQEIEAAYSRNGVAASHAATP